MLTIALVGFCALIAAPATEGGPQVHIPCSAIYAGRMERPKAFRMASDKRFQPVVDAFVADWHLPIDSKRGTPIELIYDPGLRPEQYGLHVSRKITIKASSTVGAAWGLSSLAAMLHGDKWFTVSSSDEPAVSFRTLSLDVARRYHSPSTLRTLIRWCNLAKIRTIQLHLTDDQNWMLPSKVLQGIDKNNAHGRPAYTPQELRQLQTYGEARGVAVIPEIDFPGHSSLLVKHDPKLFQIQGSESANCVNFGSKDVRSKLKQLLTEVYGLFPKAHFIHLGGDEAWYPDAEKDPHMAASAQALGLSVKEVFVDFVSELAEHVIASGRTPIVWEGFHASEFAKKRIPKKTLVVAWEGPYYPAKRLVPDGFQVINAGWDPHYVVNHYPYDVNTLVPLERLLRWSHLDFGIVQWSAKEDAGFRFQDAKAVRGSMMCWWEGHEWNAQTLLPPRILAFGASLWSSRRPSYDQLCLAWKRLEAAMEEPRLGFKATIAGTVSTSDRQFTDRTTLKFVSSQKGLRFAVRTDGQPPSTTDLIPGNTFEITDSATISVRAYKGQVAAGEVLFLPIKKVSVVPSLTTGCPVSVDGARDPQFSAASLTDGISNGPTGYWLAYPCPQTATIDLGKPQQISQIQVVTQWQNGAPTSYTVEGSLDRKTWSLLVNNAGNRSPATEAGYVNEFAPTQTRYLRLTALGGNLFPNTMARILEVRAN